MRKYPDAMVSGLSCFKVGDSARHEMLGIGIRNDSQLGEISYISFHTKAGVQILEPNEDGKVTWATR